MTEAEWNACTDPTPMLTFLQGKASERKQRFFGVACCRRIWPLLVDERSRKAVEVAECYADGLSGKKALANALAAADSASKDFHNSHLAEDSSTRATGPAQAHAYAGYFAAIAASFTVVVKKWSMLSPCEYAYSAAGKNAGNTSKRQASHTNNERQRSAEDAEKKEQTLLIRCVFGNPFRPLTLDSSWPARNNGTVVKLAQAIYDERAFDRMPILADALEEAGCHDSDILAHCRGPSPHVRGCRVVDLLLGKA